MIVRITAILLGAFSIAAAAFAIWALYMIIELKDLYEKEKPTHTTQEK